MLYVVFICIFVYKIMIGFIKYFFIFEVELGKLILVIDYSWIEGINNGNYYCIGDVGNFLGIMMLEIKDVEIGNFISFLLFI